MDTTLRQRDESLIGTIAQVHGPVVDIACERLPPLHQALRSRLDSETYTFEVYQHLDERHVRAITLHATAGLQRGLRIQVRRPFEQIRRQAVRFSHPPILNLDPFTFVTDLIDQYLYAVLHEVFYSSLMAENIRRFRHMDQAVRRLGEDISELALKRNSLRQEEITEEIEVVMLSVEALKKW